MQKCPNCGAHVPDQDVFCGECGARVQDDLAAPLEPASPAGEYLGPAVEKAGAGEAKKGSKRIIPIAIIGCATVAVVLVACGVLAMVLANRSRSTGGPTSLGGSPVPPATRARRVSAPTSAPIFEESFDDNSREWGAWEDENGAKGVDGGVYYITVNEADWASWGTSEGRTFDDFVAEVEGQAAGGPDDNGYGLVFRYQDSDNFYYYQISSDGYYNIGKMVADEWESLVKWTESDLIRQGRQTNTLRVECEGPQMTFFVNDYELEKVTDYDFDGGSLGFIAEAGDVPGVRVHFDNLKVWGTE